MTHSRIPSTEHFWSDPNDASSEAAHLAGDLLLQLFIHRLAPVYVRHRQVWQQTVRATDSIQFSSVL